ncbi:MAG: hypothetical protein A2508_00135 [Candidatus Lambdaproteobacteria bacterium RIFOXYD12_FULL_49_8]|uniref:Uncharacterized protein n=1 Tax=Candidatus Lambdaproteobacteria bacterium RIFOXYD2_FULL_50_16 TaxID=1817772 RepID=A0A1F6GEX5_9PROT|nr:MAG: hypothetical protein A2527_03640 [Candidatus Lambdaproteobacteria bacterium RIFOXYD2_FULL_50_16]OGG97487.1 MAG: hypothetical protein A2508_00135 [Candidatus Lambdaproteobacteria bacterium RIFOXYD12_FULL_49_8]
MSDSFPIPTSEILSVPVTLRQAYPGLGIDAERRLRAELAGRFEDRAKLETKLSEAARLMADLDQAPWASGLASEARQAASQFHWEKALNLYLAHLALLPPPAEAQTSFEAAMVQQFLGHYKEAESLFRRAIRLVPREGRFLAGLALLEVEQGRFTQATHSCLAVLDLLVKGQTDYLAAQIYNALGLCRHSLYKPQEALNCYQLALKLERAGFEENPVLLAQLYGNIGAAWRELGELEKAIEHNLKTLALFEEALGEEHIWVAFTYNNLGSAFAAKGEHLKALDFFKKSLPIKEKGLGPAHISTAQTHTNLATLFNQIGHFPKALEQFEKALAIYLQRKGPAHTTVGMTRFNLANTYRRMGDKGAGVQEAKKALQIFETNLPAKHEYCLKSAQLLRVLSK